MRIAESTALWGVTIAALIGLVTIPLYGVLSDRLGRRPLYLGGVVFSLLFAFPFFWLVNTESALLIWLAIVLGVNVGHDLMYGLQAAFFSELFGTRVRYRWPRSRWSPPGWSSRPTRATSTPTTSASGSWSAPGANASGWPGARA